LVFLLGNKKWLFGVIWLVLFILGFAIMQSRGISENLPENLLAEPNYSNMINSYISMSIGVLINFVGLFIQRKKKILQ